MSKLLFLNSFFFCFCLSVQAATCNQANALKTAQEYVAKDSPKGSKVSVRSIKDHIYYTVVLLDEYGAYSASGKLKVVTGEKGGCEIKQQQKSMNTTSAAEASSAPFPQQKKTSLETILKK